MQIRARLFISSLFFATCFSINAFAQEAVNSGMWSDSSTWAGGNIPVAGDQVTINDGIDVVLDTDTPALNGLTISGKLSFSNEADLELSTEWILVFGELEIGTEANPHTSNATITLTDNVKNEQLMGMGDRGIMMSGGTLNLHGNITNTWTKLDETAEAGSSTIEVLNADQWKVGDEIVLASTDFNPRQAETRHITAISGNTITLDEPLQYMHFGEITFDIDERGEVGLLTRNIKVNASADAEESYFGGHIMAMVTSEMYVEGVELHRMGQHMELARYPIHWHLVGERGAGQYVRNAAIHDTFNRCVTVHGTNDLRVENNVTYNTVGHCFFMEDGMETGNEFVKNLAIQTKCHPTMECVPVNLAANGEIDTENLGALMQSSFSGEHTLLPSDNTVSSFWITNPDNTYIDNVAAGSDETGFWFSLPMHPQGAFLGSEDSLNTWPRRTPLREFRGNVAHSNFDGFMIDRHINQDDTFGTASISLVPLANPADLESEGVESHFENLTSYKNRNGGLWGRGDLFIYSNMKLADNAIGMTQAAGDIGVSRFSSLLVDSLVVGETDNIGNPSTPEEIAYGRSLPKPSLPDFPIRGYEYYDYRDDVVNTTFVNYQDNDLRKTGALSFLLFTSAGLSSASTISGAEFVNAKPVYFPHYDQRFDNDNRGGDAYRTLSFRDLDGSVTGIPDSQVLLHDGEHDSVVTDDTCEIHPTWNASVCTGDIGRLNLSSNRGWLSGALDLESRTARYAMLSSLGPDAEDTPLVQAQRAALFSGSPPQAPIALVRNGKEFKIYSDQSTVKAGTEMQVKTEREEVTLSLTEMDQDSWVIFELPGFANAASGTEQGSMDRLHKASETSYFNDGGSMWVKLVADAPVKEIVLPTDLQTTITVSR